jgi:DNA ligase (NAD+)
MVEAIENAKNVPLERVVYALGIKGFGLSMAKLVCRQYPVKLTQMHELTEEQLVAVDGIGNKLAKSFLEFFAEESNQKLAAQLEECLSISMPKQAETSQISGMTFVITGTLELFANRSECKERIEQAGGKVSSSVSKNTNYLVNNNIASTSSKNKKAKELDIPIITERELMELLGGN